MLSCGVLGHSLRNNTVAPLAGNAVGRRAATTVSSSKPSGAPLAEGGLFEERKWLKIMQPVKDLADRQTVPGSPPSAPRRRGRPKGSKNKVKEPRQTVPDSTTTATRRRGRPKGSKNKVKEPGEALESNKGAISTQVLGISTLGYDGPKLSPEQARVVNLAAQGRNIFYTGSAGCGKSTVLLAVVQRLNALGKRVEVMAPTGKAALAINGSTTWTFAGWNPNSFKVGIDKLKESAAKPSSKVRQRFRRTDVIIIDEISMVENLHFERLNQVMKAARAKKRSANGKLPFGGVQVIVTGDFAQLPPVRPFQHCYGCGSEIRFDPGQGTHDCRRCKASYPAVDQWAFRSKAWKECDFAHVHLKTIHRQHDDTFISMLQKCRLGDPFTSEEVDLLMNHEAETTGAVELYSTREEVRSVNERDFKKLSTKPYSFKCHDTFVWNEKKHPHLARKGERHPQGWLTCLEEHTMDRQVELKLGMRVVLLANLSLEHGLCNGSQGEIVGWTALHSSEEASSAKFHGLGSADTHKELRREQIAAFEEKADPVVWPIVRFTNGMKRTIGAVCVVNELGDDEPYSLLCRTQIPLAPAWALSIHKAQGMTLDRVKVDLSKAFTEGQVYVALSRATSLQGLKVVGDPKGLMVGKGGNKEVRAFYKEKFGL